MRQTQRERLKLLFELRRNQKVYLPEIIRRLGIAQYNARILELRREGMNIESGGEIVNGQRHTWFIYRTRELQDTLF